ncbi:hypothetical protein ACSHWG_02170 [Leucobacter sp. Z1108]|uniref:hypothetical protein n=1 Tax=Leucobacter sp. Z1108 TaxID=3439066 RepID=UPI003F3D0E67
MKVLVDNRWFVLVVIPIILALISSAFVVNAAQRHTQVSPVDEYVYIDYTAKIPEQGVVILGDETGDLAREYISCQGVAGYGEFNPDACRTGDFSEDEEYPYAGKTAADIYTPLYFAVAWAFAAPLEALIGVDFLDGARLSGILWLSSSVVLLYFALLRLRVQLVVSAAVPLMIVGSLAAWWSTTFLSTDATALFAGSLLFYVLVWYLQKGQGIWLVTLAGILSTLLKFQNFMAVALVASVILVAAGFERASSEALGLRHLTWKQSIRGASLVLIAPVVAQLAWMLIRSALASGSGAEQGVADPLSIPALLGETTKFIGGMVWGASTAASVPVFAAVVGVVMTWLLVGGAVASSLSGGKGVTFESSLGYFWIAIATVAAPLLGVATYFMAGFYFSLPARYGISLLPIGLAIAAITLGRNAIWRTVLVAFALYAVGVSFFPVLTQ